MNTYGLRLLDFTPNVVLTMAVFAHLCKNRHGQNGIGGEIKEAEPVGVHDIAEEFREGRAEPTVEEQREEGVPVWSQSRSAGQEYLRARMRSRLRRPEEIVVLPQLLRVKLRGEDGPLLLQRREPLRLGRLHALPLVGFRSHGGGGGGGRWHW